MQADAYRPSDMPGATTVPTPARRRFIGARPPVERTTPSLVERVRLGIGVAVLASLLFVLADVVMGADRPLALQASRLSVAVVGVLCLFALRRRSDDARATSMGLVLIGTGLASATVSGAVAGELMVPPLVYGGVALAAAALLPWSLRAQALVVVMAVLAGGVNALREGGVGYSSLALGAAFALSLYLTQALGRARGRAEAVELALREDIARRIRAEDALRESEETLRAVLEGVQDVIMKVALDGTIEFVNRAYPPVTVEQIVGTSVFDYAPADQHDALRALHAQVLATRRSTTFDMTASLHGGTATFRSRVGPLLRDGEVVGFTYVAANITEQLRVETAQREEAESAAALARVGRALIASLDEPVLLQRLCELTTEVFHCDASHTFLAGEDGFSIVAGHGDRPEQWESQRALHLPRALVQPVLDGLQRHGVLQLVMDEAQDIPVTALSRRYGVTLGVYFAFRKGEEIVGIQSAAFRGRREPLTPAQLRLAASIAHLASLALETARLVEALEDADRFKTGFLANMSHELRTPLNVIIGYNEMLLDGACGPIADEQRAMLQRVQRNARELLQLVTTALEISRYEAHGIPLEVEPVVVPALLDDLARETGALPEKPDVAVEWRIEPGLPTLATDLLKLKMVLKNLIDNGLKFTSRGAVTIEARRAGEGIEFRIRDTGVGIPPAAQEAIFEPFRQGDHTRAQQGGGVGLGLYIVRRLVDALGGHIGVESTVGVGSTFSVWIPAHGAGDRHARPLEGRA